MHDAWCPIYNSWWVFSRLCLKMSSFLHTCACIMPRTFIPSRWILFPGLNSWEDFRFGFSCGVAVKVWSRQQFFQVIYDTPFHITCLHFVGFLHWWGRFHHWCHLHFWGCLYFKVFFISEGVLILGRLLNLLIDQMNFPLYSIGWAEPGDILNLKIRVQTYQTLVISD